MNKLITDEQSLLGATYTQSNIKLRVYDESFGPLYVHQQACGHFGIVTGIVRANSWEDAYQCVIDEILEDANQDDLDDWAKENPEAADNGELPEGMHHRDGTPDNDQLESRIAYSDPNESLTLLTPELCNALEINLILEEEDGSRKHTIDSHDYVTFKDASETTITLVDSRDVDVATAMHDPNVEVWYFELTDDSDICWQTHDGNVSDPAESLARWYAASTS